MGEAELSAQHFEFLRGYIRERTGISLDQSKQQLVQTRLRRRLRALGLSSFGEYCALLERDPESETSQLANAITTNVTDFFRHADQFEFLAKQILVPRRGQRLRIWSAGCSIGAEPYSMAITAHEAGVASGDFKILATDLDRDSLALARDGEYPLDQLRGLDPQRLSKWFDVAGGVGRVRKALRQLITFKPLNLMDRWPVSGPFQAIFCRNVMIYFDKPTQHDLVRRYTELLEPGGCFFVGNSESLVNRVPGLEHVGRCTYRKVGP